MTHFPIPDQAMKESGAIIGRTGSGKTFAAKGLVERMLKAQARVCIVDPTSVWWGLRSSLDGKNPAFPVVVFGGDHADVPLAETSGAAVGKLLAEQNLPAIVDVAEFTSAGRTRFMTAFLDELYQFNRSPLILVVDEADMFAPQRPGKEQLTMLGRMEQICRRGRVRGFRPWLITQRPASLHKSVLSQANTLVAMQLTAPQDRDALGDWIEGQADRVQGKKILAELPKLKKGEGFVWAPHHEILERAKFPPITTYDSSRTPEDGEPLPVVTLAKIDLSEILESLEDAHLEAEENDPRRLRAEIERLQRELEEKSRVLSIQNEPDADALLAEFERGRASAGDDSYDLCEALIEEVESHMRGMEVAISRTRSERDERVSISSQEKEAAKPSPAPREIATPAPAAPRVLPSKVKAGIPGSQQRILDALAWLRSIGLEDADKTQLAFLSDQSPKSSGYANNLGALRSAGLIEYPGHGRAQLTPLGGQCANGPTKPPTSAELQAMVKNKVPGAQWRILEVLIRTYPKHIDKGALADLAGQSVTSSGYANNLGALRSLGLIDYPSHGRVVALPVLFVR